MRPAPENVSNDFAFGSEFDGHRADQVSASIGRISAVPIPAALPLLASALGALGLLGWRRRRT